MPDETANSPVVNPPTSDSSLLDKPVPNPLAKNPNVHTHKVFAAIGIILIVMVIIGSGIWYFVQSAEDKVELVDETTVTKTATSSAKESWKTHTVKDFMSFDYPTSWTVSSQSVTVILLQSPNLLVTNTTLGSKPYADAEANRGTYVIITKEPYISDKKLIDYVKQLNSSVTADEGTYTQTTLGQEDSVRFDSKIGSNNTVKNSFILTVLYTLHEGNLFTVYRSYPEDMQSEFESTFQKVVSTVKFL